MIIAKFIAVVLIGYLLGSIPFGLIIAKLKSNIDIRNYGSGKTGATNVLRAVGTKASLLVIICDVSKATGAVLLAKVIVGSGLINIAGIPVEWQAAQVMAGLAAVAGHTWPIFTKFKGGRGVTAFFGTILAISPPLALFGGEVLAISALRSKHMSLGSILGIIATWCMLIPLTIIYNWPPIYLAYCLAAIGLVIYQHRDNMARLRHGTERRLGERIL
ncbi:MAG: glycerol-3-phosphate 1-O-acyltransferase PlsY [Dehalococcoidia bacterium]|nr:glycerol-3-phosphate 1-O-acyltransferase PlsY [Dehalococcoidia bacterium]